MKSRGRLLFAAGAAGCILVGIWFKERGLIHQFGDSYNLAESDAAVIGKLDRRREARVDVRAHRCVAHRVAPVHQALLQVVFHGL